MFGCGSPGCECLQLENITLIFSGFSCVRGKIARNWLWFVLPLRKLIDFLLLTFWEYSVYVKKHFFFFGTFSPQNPHDSAPLTIVELALRFFIGWLFTYAIYLEEAKSVFKCSPKHLWKAINLFAACNSKSAKCIEKKMPWNCNTKSIFCDTFSPFSKWRTYWKKGLSSSLGIDSPTFQIILPSLPPPPPPPLQ